MPSLTKLNTRELFPQYPTQARILKMCLSSEKKQNLNIFCLDIFDFQTSIPNLASTFQT